MWYNFWTQNLNFALEVFVGLVCLATAWLYFDSWVTKKEAKTLIRAFGFLVLAVWAVLGATLSDQTIIQWIVFVTKFLGIALLLLSFVVDPVPKLPGETKQNKKKAIAVAPLAITTVYLQPAVFSSILLLIITYLVFVRFSKGLIREWRSLFLAFLLFTISEIVTILYSWQSSSNVLISRLLQEYGTVWFIEHGLKLMAFVILARWTWGYIRFRLIPQFFITFVTVIFVVFVITTIAFTTLLLHNVEQDQLTQLGVSVKTVDYAIDRLENEAVLASQMVAENSAVKEALSDADTEKLFTVTNRLMFESGTDFLMTVNEGADILMRAEDKSKIGSNLANDPVVIRAFDGRSTASIASEDGVNAPVLSIRAASPVYSVEGKIIGAVVTGYIIDNAFVDGIKKVTDLDVSFYGGSIRSATTIFTPGTTTRDIGIAEINQKVNQQVLNEESIFTGSVEILSTPYYTAYTPLIDIDNTVLGMISIGRPEKEILEATNRTIRNTFVFSVILMVIAVFPAFFLAKYISRHQRT